MIPPFVMAISANVLHSHVYISITWKIKEFCHGQNVISFASKILEGLKQAELDKGLAVNIL